MEITGVLYLGCNRENHSGKRWSHPATIGRRALPAVLRLQLPICRPISNRMAAGATSPAQRKRPSASVNTWGIGPTKSTWPGNTNANTELVPRMNIRQMMGDTMSTDRLILRAGFLHSPAKIATYSKPQNAPIEILLKIFTLNRDMAGAVAASGWYSRAA